MGLGTTKIYDSRAQTSQPQPSFEVRSQFKASGLGFQVPRHGLSQAIQQVDRSSLSLSLSLCALSLSLSLSLSSTSLTLSPKPRGLGFSMLLGSLKYFQFPTRFRV